MVRKPYSNITPDTPFGYGYGTSVSVGVEVLVEVDVRVGVGVFVEVGVGVDVGVALGVSVEVGELPGSLVFVGLETGIGLVTVDDGNTGVNLIVCVAVGVLLGQTCGVSDGGRRGTQMSFHAVNLRGSLIQLTRWSVGTLDPTRFAMLKRVSPGKTRYITQPGYGDTLQLLTIESGVVFDFWGT